MIMAILPLDNRNNKINKLEIMKQSNSPDVFNNVISDTRNPNYKLVKSVSTPPQDGEDAAEDV